MKPIAVFLCAVFSFLPGYGADLIEGRDLFYASYGEKKLHLDWFRPAGEDVLPAVVVVHGGGWIGGQRSSFETIAKDIALAGFVAVNMEYRKKLDEAEVMNRFAIVPGARHGEWGKAKFRTAFVGEILRFFSDVFAALAETPFSALGRDGTGIAR